MLNACGACTMAKRDECNYIQFKIDTSFDDPVWFGFGLVGGSGPMFRSDPGRSETGPANSTKPSQVSNTMTDEHIALPFRVWNEKEVCVLRLRWNKMTSK